MLLLQLRHAVGWSIAPHEAIYADGRLVSRLSPERYRMTRLRSAKPFTSSAAHAAYRLGLGQSVERRHVIRYLRVQIEDKINCRTDGCSFGNASLISG